MAQFHFMWQISRSDALFSTFAKTSKPPSSFLILIFTPSLLCYTHTHTYVHTDPCWASAVVIRYSLSNCQTSTGTRHQTPTLLANPPDAASHSDWLLPPPLHWLWPSKLAYEPSPHISIGCLRDTWLVFTDALRLHCSQRRIQLSSLQRKTTPFITSFSLSLSPHLSLSVFRRFCCVVMFLSLSLWRFWSHSKSSRCPGQTELPPQTIEQLKLISDPGRNKIIPKDVVYLDWSPWAVLFF